MKGSDVARLALAIVIVVGSTASSTGASPRSGATADAVVGVGDVFAKGGEAGLVVYGALLLVFMTFIGQWFDRRASRAFSQDVLAGARDMAEAVTEAAAKYSEGAKAMADAIESSADKHSDVIREAVTNMTVQAAKMEHLLNRVDSRLDRDERRG